MFVLIVGTKHSAERMDNVKYYDCCICGQVCMDLGNNPWPVVKDADARCCDRCNDEVVIPARIKRMMEKDSGAEQSK